jgi:hypothetical protein
MWLTVAQALQVSARATVEHLYHLMLIDESDRELLVEQLGLARAAGDGQQDHGSTTAG